MSINFDYKKIALKTLTVIGHYRVTITAVVILVIFGLSFIRINTYTNPQVNDTKLTELKAETKKAKIDQEIVDKVNSLVDSQVEIDPSFGNRSSPFAE